VIQTTAPISPGSSVGVLLNLRGEVIRVTAFLVVDGQNLNFAIPASSPVHASNYLAARLALQINVPQEDFKALIEGRVRMTVVPFSRLRLYCVWPLCRLSDHPRPLDRR